jgi:hypothetical protein
LDNDSNSLIDFGPKGNFFKFDKGVNNWVEYASNGRLQQTIDIPGNIFKEPITIKGVNLNILQKYSNWLKNKPGFYNFALRSCSTQAARGLTLSGVPYGHIQMYDGNHKQWISNWRQAGFWPGRRYLEKSGPFQIYRWR